MMESVQIESKGNKRRKQYQNIQRTKSDIGLLGLSFGNYISKEKLFVKSFTSVKRKFKFQN